MKKKEKITNSVFGYYEFIFDHALVLNQYFISNNENSKLFQNTIFSGKDLNESLLLKRIRCFETKIDDYAKEAMPESLVRKQIAGAINMIGVLGNHTGDKASETLFKELYATAIRVSELFDYDFGNQKVKMLEFPSIYSEFTSALLARNGLSIEKAKAKVKK